MFVQVIQGWVSDEAEMRAAHDQWVHELARGAEGWLGSTAGVTDDGRFVALARFESEEAARRNSARPEQDEWWAQTAKLLTGDAVLRDSINVVPDIVGNPDRATFVQIIQGQSSDPARARELMTRDSAAWAAFRPDVIGSLEVDHDGGFYTMAAYFTSEADARAAETRETPPELRAQMQEMEALHLGVPQFLDLSRPWLYSAE